MTTKSLPLLFLAGVILVISTSFNSLDNNYQNKNELDNNHPNIILIMADDLGYGDTGFTGNPTIQTPNLDQIANEGAILTNFYSGGSVCSPTRGTFLTGRHHHRYGVFWANEGHLPKEEITLAEILKEQGYATGHFGKWHLGTLSKIQSAKGEQRKPALNFSPPGWHGYDTSFVTESAIALWDPAEGKRALNNPFWLNGIALDADDPSLQGGASRVVMDKTLPFIKQSVIQNRPFLAVIWFHAPHMDVIAGPNYLSQYKEHGEAAHYYGVVSEMDEQIGRLRRELKTLGIDQNTLITFTSDNGPEGKTRKSKGRTVGVTGGLKGHKRDLYEGGIRVPTVMLWPDKIKPGRVIDTIGSTLDLLPTVNDIVSYSMPDNRPVDGVSLLPILLEQPSTYTRTKSIPFIAKRAAALIDGDYKLVVELDNPEQVELYNLKIDRSETANLAALHPHLVQNMKEKLYTFIDSAKASHAGDDYSNGNFKPIDKWPLSNNENTAADTPVLSIQ